MNYIFKTFIAFLCLCSFVNVHSQTITVSNSAQLNSALQNAQAGQTIVLTDGLYSKSGGYSVPAGKNGTANNPNILKGSKSAIVTCNSLSSGYGLHLNGNSYWIIEGFTIYNSAKGIVLDSSFHNTIDNLTVIKSGSEAIHLRTYSSYNTVSNCFIDSTGSLASAASSGYAEGIYIGSANSNWATYTKGQPDTCNYNTISYNTFGDNILSENIDIKEGTKGGLIKGNTFNGKGCNGNNSADSWVDVKGNYYQIECNTGTNNYYTGSGLQTHVVYAGYGNYNTFSNNNLNVNASGYGIYITKTSSKGIANNNIVCNNNTTINASSGLSNISTSTCSGTCSTITSSTKDIITFNLVYPNPFTDKIIIQGFENATKKIFNSLGIIVLETTENIINTSQFPCGNYILHTINNQTLTIHKVIKTEN